MKTLIVILIAIFLAIDAFPQATPFPPQEIINVTGVTFIDTGKRYVTLRWSGAFSNAVNIMQDGQVLMTTSNDQMETFRVKRNETHVYSIEDPDTGVLSGEVTL